MEDDPRSEQRKRMLAYGSQQYGAREAGAGMAYRVSVTGDQVAVDGFSNGRRCALQTEAPSALFRRMLPDRYQYQLR